ncbi:hypothetical protein [Actinomadura violacea]|uniref:DMSO/TMAO reductase YedYZ heme-binding membrane subunit n=1 Tax=Actinomadura violacea TaxID=2819934 RepID=A0ABS3RYI9_9ACTN|nr:hypothetical protein [Actinomadura violacea]MBO2461824.1 hypothetical protein [Actinomadura violacea]
MRTRNSDDPAVPAWVLRTVLAGAVLVLAGAATPPGAVAAAQAQYFLSFYAGVFTLLALTGAVMTGLLATERLILKIRHRVLAQGAHRACAVVASVMVVAHIAVKVLGGLAAPAQIVVPTPDAIGLGTVAFELMVLIVITGILRTRFVARARPWVWRSMHAVAYISWPIGILHGLTAGRLAANWVVLSYVMSVVGVLIALVTRLIVVIRPREVGRAGDAFGAGERAAAAAAARRARGRFPDHDPRPAAPYGHDAPRRYDDDPRAYDDPRGTDDLRNLDDPRGYDDAPRGMDDTRRLDDARMRDGARRMDDPRAGGGLGGRDSRATVTDPRGVPLPGEGGGWDTEVIR